MARRRDCKANDLQISGGDTSGDQGHDGAVRERAFRGELSGLDIFAALAYDMLAIKTKTARETSRQDFLITESCCN
jgi:hypothetical protein